MASNLNILVVTESLFSIKQNITDELFVHNFNNLKNCFFVNPFLIEPLSTHSYKVILSFNGVYLPNFLIFLMTL